MKILKIEIEKCKDCPFFEVGPSYSFDGFDRGEDILCSHPALKDKSERERTLAFFVERDSERDSIKPPFFCPLEDK